MVLKGDKVFDFGDICFWDAGQTVCQLPPGQEFKDYMLVGKERRAREFETLRECQAQLEILIGD